MVNPVSPLILSEDIDAALELFYNQNYDTLVSVREERLQSFYNQKPINFSLEQKLPKTQDIKPIQICVWTLAIWRAEPFVRAYEQNGYAVFNGKVGFFPIPLLRSIKVSYEEDFLTAEALLKLREQIAKQK